MILITHKKLRKILTAKLKLKKQRNIWSKKIKPKEHLANINYTLTGKALVHAHVAPGVH